VDENGNVISQGLATAATPTLVANIDPQMPVTAPAVATPVPETAPAVSQPSPEPKIVAEAPTEEQSPEEASAPLVPTPEISAPETPIPEAQEPAPAPPASYTPPTPEPNPSSSDTGASSSKASGYGIGWSGYKGAEASLDCKNFDDADKEWSQMHDYDLVRVYGTDCEQPEYAFQLAKKYNKKVFMGVYFLDERLTEEIQTIINAVKSSGSSWDAVDTISVGNEDVHRGEKTSSQIFDAIAQSGSQLQAAGYNGPIVHVDSQEAILAHPGLCSHEAGDYIAANVHPFFNSQTSADQAGDFVQGQIDLLKQCGMAKRHRRDGVRVRVTETGWPKNGDTNGVAVPSKDNQRAAVDSIKSTIADDVIMFSAFNNYWMKDGASTFNTEHYWGLLDD
jgi:exo-beta-1,3-glucanase (GH17 family)